MSPMPPKASDSVDSEWKKRRKREDRRSMLEEKQLEQSKVDISAMDGIDINSFVDDNDEVRDMEQSETAIPCSSSTSRSERASQENPPSETTSFPQIPLRYGRKTLNVDCTHSSYIKFQIMMLWESVLI